MVLAPVLPPATGESTVSWCSRLAAHHAGMACADWLQMMQISRQSVVDTTETCVERLGELTGIAEDRVRACGVQRGGNRVFKHRSEIFGPRFALRTHTTYCPACLLEDSAPNAPGRGHRIGQVVWVFSPVRTCPQHGTSLHRRPNKGFHEQFQDMNVVAPDDTGLEQQAAQAKTRVVSPLQIYTERRFSGEKQVEWLDLQQIDQAARACEMLGVCLAFGAHKDLDKLSLAQWDEAGATGFAAACEGPRGIRRALEEIAERSMCEKPQGGPQAAFGRLYQWLQFNKSNRDPGPIKDVVREHILDTIPVEAQTLLFGSPVAERRRHSVSTLARSAGVHPKTLEHALVRAGVLSDSGQPVSDARTTFDAEIGEELASRIKYSIPVSKIPAYLNCNRTQAQMLVKYSVLNQLVPELGRRGGVLTNVPTADLDDFLSQFRAFGRPVALAGEGMMDVIQASEVARETVTDIVRLVLDRRLSRVQLLQEDLRFRSVLVHPDEIKAVARESESKAGLSAKEVAHRLGVFPSGVTWLRKTADRDGRLFLSPLEFKNARGTVRYRYPEEEVARFKARHVKLTAFARERGLSSKAASKSLAAAGVEPILRQELLNARLFRRADLP